MRFGVVLLLVARLVEFPLVDVVELGTEVHFMVPRYLVHPALCVGHDIQELMEEHVGVVLLALLQRLELGRRRHFQFVIRQSRLNTRLQLDSFCSLTVFFRALKGADRAEVLDCVALYCSTRLEEVVIETELAVVADFVLMFPLGEVVQVLQPVFIVAKQKRLHSLDPRFVNRLTDCLPHQLTASNTHSVSDQLDSASRDLLGELFEWFRNRGRGNPAFFPFLAPGGCTLQLQA